MTARPDFATFRDLAEPGRLVPVFRQLTSDTLTPVSAYARLRSGHCPFLFESVIGGERVGRYSFLGIDPFLILSARGLETTWTRGDQSETRTVEDPLDELQHLLDAHDAVTLPELPPFCGGAVGYAGYDIIRYTEDLPNAPPDDRNLPDLFFGFYDRMVIFDHIHKTVFVVAYARIPDDPSAGDLQSAYDAAINRINALTDRLAEPLTGLAMKDLEPIGSVAITPESNMTREQHRTAVETAREYIRAGDIFQVVLSQRLRHQTSASALDIYRSLRVVNPSPFMFLLELPDCSLIGSSPEIMVRVENRVVTIRPLAGTRRRGKTDAEDKALADELLADPKERAEHVMLVDLGRNDVGRVSKYGTVTLSDVMIVERYSHVMHITSNVNGELRDDCTALDALRAGLPVGTVSGAPKVRAMEIIDELEPTRRGPYAGAVGHIGFSGDMDTCIALRTIVMRGDVVDIQAGGGIVADSVPEAEYQETLNKAMGLLRAITLAESS